MGNNKTETYGNPAKADKVTANGIQPTGESFVSPDVIIREYKAGITTNISDAISRYIYWAIVFYGRVSKKTSDFFMSEKKIAELFGVSVKTVNSATVRSKIFYRAGARGQRRRAWELKPGVVLIFEKDDKVNGDGTTKQGAPKAPRFENNQSFNVKDHSPSKCGIISDLVLQNEDSHNKEVNLKQENGNNHKAGERFSPLNFEEEEKNGNQKCLSIIGNSSKAPSLPAQSGKVGIPAGGGKPPTTAKHPEPIILLPASIDEIGKSMDMLIPKINGIVNCNGILQGCFRWGLVLTTVWLAKEVGDANACQMVKDSIEGHTKAPEGIQHIRDMFIETIKWEPFTAPHKLAMSDWRERLSDILKIIGELKVSPFDYRQANNAQSLGLKFLAEIKNSKSKVVPNAVAQKPVIVEGNGSALVPVDNHLKDEL